MTYVVEKYGKHLPPGIFAIDSGWNAVDFISDGPTLLFH